MQPNELIVDSFAGGGGASQGILWALGRSPDIAINHDKEAIALHAANHPESLHLAEDVWHVDPVTVCAGRSVGLMWLSPDCFPAGTMVLTDKGYRAIETIKVGDRVLTHRCRWRKVTEANRTTKPLMTIRGHGHPGLSVSPEHPFYARLNQRHKAEWLPASLLSKDWYWASPKFFPRENVREIADRPVEVDENLMWLVGRYVGDGWTRLTKTRAEVVITCNVNEADALRERLSLWPRGRLRSGPGEITWHERRTKTAYQFTASHRGLVVWLREHFGHRSEAKLLPAWALGMEPKLRKALLAGYLSADGSEQKAFIECTTVSKALAFSIKALAQSLGKTVTVYLSSNSDVIEGRRVLARPIYKLRWRHEVDAQHAQTFTQGDLQWTPIREVIETTTLSTVYNIGVEDDESYVVEGIIVHNCKHFSKAKGGKPVSKKIRGLAWVAVRWANAVRPRVIVLENVEEFQTWGPVLASTNKPCPERKGQTFRAFKRKLERLGYVVEHRELRACDYGAPTIRKRLFLIARCDGVAIMWPAPTHGKNRAHPWRTAAECIQWEIPCPSIFERKKPLAENTQRRIARGLKRFVLDSPNPFIVNLTHHGYDRVEGLDEPMRTITGAKRGEKALITPYIARIGQTGGGGSYTNDAEDPLTTVTSKAEHLLVAPLLTQRYGEWANHPPRAKRVDEPLATIVPTENSTQLVAAFMAKHYGGNESPGSQLTMPLGTVTTQDHNHLVTSHLQPFGQNARGSSMTEPMQTVVAGATRYAEVRAFMVAYYGNEKDGGDLHDPMRTVTSKERFGLVTVDGIDYAIADIGMRMLAPRELYRAQGFEDTYKIDIEYNGKPLTKTAQVRMVGNSVCPPLAAAIVSANYATPAVEVAA